MFYSHCIPQSPRKQSLPQGRFVFVFWQCKLLEEITLREGWKESAFEGRKVEIRRKKEWNLIGKGKSFGTHKKRLATPLPSSVLGGNKSSQGLGYALYLGELKPLHQNPHAWQRFLSFKSAITIRATTHPPRQQAYHSQPQWTEN